MLRWWLLACALLPALSAAADETSAAPPPDPTWPTIIRIGTGGSKGAYFPIGQLIAEAVSSRAGTPELLGVAQLSAGSAANVEDLAAGRLEVGLAQADIAHAAYTGVGSFAEQGALASLRAIATLYQESIHLVARRDSGIHSVRDLAGKRVSLDEPGSGTLIGVRQILQAYGLQTADLQPVYLETDDAIERLLEKQLDAFFIIAGPPIWVISQLLAVDIVELVPIDGPEAEALMAGHPYLTRTLLGPDVYPGVSLTTLSVGAQLLTRQDLDEALVYRLTASLWSEATRRHLNSNHPLGRSIRLDSALDGLMLPLHPGAARYYREVGLNGLQSLTGYLP